MPCWECELCGYIWLKVKGRDPKRCAGRTCRKRAWNKPINTVQDVKVHAPALKTRASDQRTTCYMPAKYLKGKKDKGQI